jgi:hypothetical protein
MSEEMKHCAIPDDIMKIAEETLDTLLCNDTESCGGTDALHKAAATEIARAILAERNRCAKIADDQATHWRQVTENVTEKVTHIGGLSYQKGRWHVAVAIATDIRRDA